MVSAFLKERLLTALGVGLVSAAAVVMSSDRANAFAFGNSWDDGCRVRTATTNTSVSNCNLQGLLNASGYSSVNTNTPSRVGIFNTGITASGNILLAVAGFSPNNTVGLFSISNPNIRQVISSSTINPAPRSVNRQNLLNIPFNISLIPGLQNTQVGLFLTNPRGFTALSTQGTANFLSYGLNGSGEKTPTQWLIAFEDLPGGQNDLDYNDFVATITFDSVAVPEPAALGGLLAIGSLLTLSRRRRKPIAT